MIDFQDYQVNMNKHFKDFIYTVIFLKIYTKFHSSLEYQRIFILQRFQKY